MTTTYSIKYNELVIYTLTNKWNVVNFYASKKCTLIITITL